MTEDKVIEQQDQQEPVNIEKVASFLLLSWKATINEIIDYMYSHNLSIEEVKAEIQKKTCKLPASKRKFVEAVKHDYWPYWMQTRIKPHTYTK